MHRPTTFQDMLLLAERADQAYMADKHGLLGPRGQHGGSKGQQQGGGQRKVDYRNVSQYGDQAYRGPAPMVLGTAQKQFTCHYCGKQGHYKRDCYKLKNDIATGKVSNGGRGGRGGGRHGNGGRQQRGNGRQHHAGGLNTVAADATLDMDEVVRLGLAAFHNKQRQQAQTHMPTNPSNKSVTFADGAEDSSGNFRQTKN